MAAPDGDESHLSDKPPFFSTWGAVYAAVLGFHGFLILLFYLVTRHFR